MAILAKPGAIPADEKEGSRRMKRIYPNLSLIGVNSTLNLLSFDVRLNVLMIEIFQLKNLETHRKDNYVIDG
jgi:hypothetical protein